MEQKKMIILVLILVVVLVLAGVGYRLLAPQAGLSGTLGGTQSASGAAPLGNGTARARFYGVRCGRRRGDACQPDGGGETRCAELWASTCPPCRSEMPDFEAAFQKYGSEVQFIRWGCRGLYEWRNPAGRQRICGRTGLYLPRLFR